MNGVPKSFNGIVCDGSHWEVDGQGGGLTKAEEDQASYGSVYSPVCCDS